MPASSTRREDLVMTDVRFSFLRSRLRGRVRESFARQGAMKLIGGPAISEVAPGYCAIAVAPRPELSQQHG
jgi:hypothetical protein